MNPNQSRLLLCSTRQAALFAAAAVGLSACSSGKVSVPRTDRPRTLSHADFVDPGARDAAPDSPDRGDPSAEQPSAAPPSQGAPAAASAPSDDTNPNAQIETHEGITLTAGRDELEPRPVTIETPEEIRAPRIPATLHLLDAKVGDVNGRPIFTNSFFEPIEDRLIAEAQRLPMNQWRSSAARIIASRLDGIIADELLRAEAMAALTPQQRVGLQAFLNNFRDNLLSENLGSSQLAARRIQEREGITLDEAMRQKEIDTLVQLTLIQEVNRRVNVSWRDIKQRYERDIDEFSPPPTARLRVIRAFKDEAEKVEAIKRRLDEGEDFAQIAAGDLNNYNRGTGGLHTAPIPESYETAKFFGPDELNQAAQQLGVGESAGPIELGSSVYWIQLEDITQESISLYDAQLGIYQDLTFERREQAKNEYFDRLQERARVSTREEVLIRLFEIAEQRYGPRR